MSDIGTVLTFIVGGVAFAVGLGVILGCVLDKCAGARKARRGFPVTPTKPRRPPGE